MVRWRLGDEIWEGDSDGGEGIYPPPFLYIYVLTRGQPGKLSFVVLGKERDEKGEAFSVSIVGKA